MRGGVAGGWQRREGGEEKRREERGTEQRRGERRGEKRRRGIDNVGRRS